MAFITQKYKIKLADLGTKNIVTNTALLSFLEDIGSIHSEKAGIGISTIDKTHLSWILLQWKLKKIEDISYGEEITVKTWASTTKKYYCFRDFEVYNASHKLIAYATSKWILYNIQNNKMEKITDEILNKYEPELDIHVFGNYELPKIVEPEKQELTLNYNVRRSDIDINNHMHNLYYLNLAYDALPVDIYENCNFSDIDIMYKKGATLNEKLQCFYSFENGFHIITIKTDNDLHAIIRFS